MEATDATATLVMSLMNQESSAQTLMNVQRIDIFVIEVDVETLQEASSAFAK